MNESLFNTFPIQSLLDTDFYKLTMQQAYIHQMPNAEASWIFKCRTSENLSPYIKEIESAIDKLSTLAITEDELDYLKTNFSFLSSDYLHFLRYFRFDKSFIDINQHKGQFSLKLEGPQVYVSPFEIPLLAIISEIRNKHCYPHMDEKKITLETEKKIDQLQKLLSNDDLTSFYFTDFGTRRRFSYQTQSMVLKQLKEALPNQLIGTSNVHFAKSFNLPCIGTMAHEWLQTHQGLNYRLIDHQKMALNNWVKEYRGELGIALTDVIGIDAFCHDLDKYFAKLYDGYRHDSGSPFDWGDKIIQRLKELGIEPQTKTLVFSDSLNFEKAAKIYKYFKHRIKLCFGIGTWLMGDFVTNTPLNMVIKLTYLNFQPVAKISDSPGKIVCQDKSYLSYLMRTFHIDKNKQEMVLKLIEKSSHD